MKALQSALAAATAEKARLAEEASKLSAELSSRDRVIAELRTAAAQSESDASGGAGQVDQLQSMVEMLTLDKALAEEQFENSQAELSNLQTQFTNLELEHQLLKEQHAALQHAQAQASEASAAAGGGTLITSESAEAGSSAANAKLIEQNQLLSDALRKLRDLNLAEKSASTARISELEKSLASLSTADKENAQLKASLSAAQASVSSLKEQLDEALELQSMVERLSSQKLDLEEQVKTLQRNVATMHALQQASEEVEEGYKELQAQLQRELEQKEGSLLDIAARYKLKTAQIEDLQQTNRKFRELVRQLEAENATLKQAQIEGQTAAAGDKNAAAGGNAKGGQDDAAAGGASTGLAATRSSTLLQRRLKQVRAAHLDALLSGVERQLIEKRLQFLSLYLPANVSVDDRSLAFLQQLERVKSKAAVLARVWAEFFGAGGAGGGGDASDLLVSSSSVGKLQIDYSAAGSSPELALLSSNACLLLASLVHGVENLTAALYTLDLDTYNALAIRAQAELSPLDTILDSYVALLLQDGVNEMTSLQNLVQANVCLFAFAVEKVPLPATLVVGGGQVRPIDELNALPYHMALFAVLDRQADQQMIAKWQELRETFKQRAATAAKRPALTGAAAALAPSAVPSLPTFASTLTYSCAQSSTLAQLVSDQLEALASAMRRGRRRKQMEEQEERRRKQRDEAVASGEAPPVEERSPSPPAASNGALSDASEDDADIALYQAAFSDVADAVLNNLTLAGQLQSAARNYANSVGSASANVAQGTQYDKEEMRQKQEAAVVALLPHVHAIDTLAHRAALQLSSLLHAIQPLLQLETLQAVSAGMSAEAPVSAAAPSSPALVQLLQLLENAKSKDAASSAADSASLLTSLSSLRSELFTLSKRLLSIIDDNASGSGSTGADRMGDASTRAIHHRQASFVLTAPESALTAAPANASDPAGALSGAPPAVLSTLQPWFHHPLTVRAQLSASAALRIALQDLSTRLQEKQKEVYLIQRQVQEEKAKQDVLTQQLSLHAARASAQSELAQVNDNLRAQLEESAKQLNLSRLELDKLQRENKAVRKQMLKLKQQYLSQEQTRAQIQAASASNVAGAAGSASGQMGGVSSANLSEVHEEVGLLRRTLAATREELALWKTKQSMHALQTQQLPPLPAFEAETPLMARSVALTPVAQLAPLSLGASALAVALPPELGWAPTPFQASKLSAALTTARNPYIAQLPPPASTAARSGAAATGDATKSLQAVAEAEADEVRLLRGRVSELSRAVWQARVSPRLVRLPLPAEGGEPKDKAADASDEKVPLPNAAAVNAASPFQQYVAQRVRAVQMQQHASKLQQRIHLLADQHKRIFHSQTTVV